MFQAKKDTRATCQIYPKSGIKTPEQLLVLLLLNWIYIPLYFTVIIAEFKQINTVWTWETIVSDNKFVFSNYGKHIVLWAWKICLTTCFHPHSPNMINDKMINLIKWEIFTTALQKGKLNPVRWCLL